MPKVVKNLLFICLGACFIWILSASFLWLSASAESVRDWEGGADYVEENGRAGIVFNAGEQTFLGIYTNKTYNMNEGITIRFRVNSIPGVQGDADAWFAFMLQNGTDTNPQGVTTGFKFLMRESDPDENPGMVIERYVCVPDGTPIAKTPLFSSVPMLGNEHYISIVQRSDGTGFLVSIDGDVTDYYDDSDAFLIDDLTEARVVVTAYKADAGLPPWEVEIDEIEPLTETEAWQAFGTAILEESENGLHVTEKPVQSGADSAVFLKQSVNIEKTQEIKLKIDQVPAFTDEFTDAYIGVILSKEEYATDINATDALIAVFKLKDRNTLVGNFGQGSMAAGLDQEIASVRPGDELNIAFGFDENEVAVITLNGFVAGHSKNIKPNNFLGKKGYISIVTFNGSTDSLCNWAYTVSSVAETDSAVPVWTENNEETDAQTPETAGTSCSGSVAGSGVLVAAAAVLLSVFAVWKKKNKENRE